MHEEILRLPHCVSSIKPFEINLLLLKFTSKRQISCANAKDDILKCLTLFFRKACSKREKRRLIKERNEKIAEYNNKLDDMKDEAVTKYCRCIIRNLKKIN